MADVSPWTDERVERLQTLVNEGLSCGQIAKVLGDWATRNSVIGKMARMRIANRSGMNPRNGKPPVVKQPNRARSASVHTKPPRPLPPVVTAAPRGSVHWLERGFGECAWPIAGAGADTISCCAPCEGEKVYCPKHCAMAYVAPKNVGGDFARSLRWYTRG